MEVNSGVGETQYLLARVSADSGHECVNTFIQKAGGGRGLCLALRRRGTHTGPVVHACFGRDRVNTGLTCAGADHLVGRHGALIDNCRW